MGKKALPTLRNIDASWGNSTWRLGNTGLTLDESSMTLLHQRRRVPLETKPFYLLMLLLRQPHKLVRRELIVRTLWGGREVSDAVVSQVISKLRKALGPGNEWLLRTIHGLGYCLELSPVRMDDIAMDDLHLDDPTPPRRKPLRVSPTPSSIHSSSEPESET